MIFYVRVLFLYTLTMMLHTHWAITIAPFSPSMLLCLCRFNDNKTRPTSGALSSRFDSTSTHKFMYEPQRPTDDHINKCAAEVYEVLYFVSSYKLRLVRVGWCQWIWIGSSRVEFANDVP